MRFCPDEIAIAMSQRQSDKHKKHSSLNTCENVLTAAVRESSIEDNGPGEEGEGLLYSRVSKKYISI
jgi:hypothetical protein